MKRVEMKTVSEIDAEVERLLKLRADVEQKEAEERRINGINEARELLHQLVGILGRLEELDYVPPKLKEALTDGKGKFNPGLYIKRPKSPGA